MLSIIPIPALKDNYIWLLISQESKKTIVVDPGEAAPVISWLEANGFDLAAILITHHHWDHTNGMSGLIANNVPVYGPENEKIYGKSHNVANNSIIELSGFPRIDIIGIPGHTLGHVAYLIDNNLFCGDTLFSAGCGRIFEGTPTQMYQSLQAMAKLPDETMVYCGHEYTLQNCRFAEVVMPNNQAVKHYSHYAETKRQQHLPTLPSSMETEKNINPFLRCDKADVKENVEKHFGLVLQTELEVFTKLREWKDRF